ncbi:MAG TPA: cyclic nucleotide-binding domain-containing protein [Syntrophales bacterium]|nr:cyclic nucleotide-binding domain-containing protein [Syntrophales bacterium]HOM06841.1 cyclic nucleotide-binding domain-containing protein [Syntrophales bacterium]HON99359.1 cyclic nucleotide-binding domain-containing protein [Syntrophales bacterium]HPC00605.1 cyclic nucleotide-binding domain-containing protein [Syntrophales bacterium]HPQ06382.1 cyclic nucleotide-binding domain-containing protein [Syntrophales bacterium]
MKEILEENLQALYRLKEQSVLRFFAKKDLHKLLRFSKIHRYAPGELIVAEGTFDNRMYVLMEGEVKVVKGGAVIDTLRRTGDIFGEMGVVDGEPRSASVYAVGEATCLVVDVSFIDGLQGEDKTAFAAVFYQIVAETLAKRLRETSAELVRLKEKLAALEGN